MTKQNKLSEALIFSHDIYNAFDKNLATIVRRLAKYTNAPISPEKEKISFFSEIPKNRLDEWNQKLNSNLDLLLNLKSFLIFIEAVRLSDVFYVHKMQLLKSAFRDVKTGKPSRVEPYSLRVKLEKNGISATWSDTNFEQGKNPLRRFKVRNYIPIGKNLAYKRTSFNRAPKDVKDYIYKEIELPLANLRQQTSTVSSIRRNLRTLDRLEHADAAGNQDNQ